MPKLLNVTKDDLRSTEDTVSDLCAALNDINKRIQGGYCDEIAKPVDLARSFLNLTRAAAETATLLLVKSAMDEMKHEARELMQVQAKS